MIYRLARDTTPQINLCCSWDVCVCVCVCVWERERERFYWFVMAKRHIIHFPASTLSILLCCNCTCVTTSASDCIATNILEQYRQWLFLQLHACRHMLIDGCISVMCIIMFSRSGTVLQWTFPAGPPGSIFTSSSMWLHVQGKQLVHERKAKRKQRNRHTLKEI
jgi:hypothetical protein